MPLLDKLLRHLSTHSLNRSVERTLRGQTTIIQSEPSSFPAILAALLATKMGERTLHNIVVVAENRTSAEIIHDDVSALLDEQVFLIPQREAFPGDVVGIPDNEKSERSVALQAIFLQEISQITKPRIFILPAVVMLEGIAQPKPPLLLQVGDLVDMDELSTILIEQGFDRESMATEPAEFSRRGGIFDIFGWGQNSIIRLEFDDIQLISIRLVDPITQRSIKEVSSASVLISDPSKASNQTIFEQLNPSTTRFILSDAAGIQFSWMDWKRSVDERKEIEHPPYLSVEEAKSKMSQYGKLIFAPLKVDQQIFNSDAEVEEIVLPYQQHEDFKGDLASFEGQFRTMRKQGWSCFLLCDAERQKDRLYELFEDRDDSALIDIPILYPSLHFGFTFLEAKLAIYTEHQLFSRTRRRGRYKRFIPSRTSLKQIEGLKRGDYVVHIDHGIGRFEGLETVRILDSEQECFRIVFAGGVSVLVRMENFSKIQPYRSEETNPTLSRIGGADWVNARIRAKKLASDMAEQIVSIHANRTIITRQPSMPDSSAQHEFEMTFEYEETPDQLVAAEEIKKDLEKDQPMDRLLIGDVGFGKTEVAMRAAWKVLQENRQVAVICPTTVLAAQHGNTFRERFRFTGANVEVLSRFTYPKDVKRILEQVKVGKIDILIGTHRLLSKDVQFKNLGILIIDEEHKFGVKHKEDLKKKRLEVDVLTLSATPIPRTLQLAISGVRDVSFIRTAPAERLPVETEVVAFDERTIREAILREISRGGQVFFVHNRIETMTQIVEKLKQIAPNVSIIMAHAQLPPHQLEQIMLDFVQNKYQVLVSSMIIESGIDLPNVNTLIVNRADMLGLAQLYQLRGRIGRSNRQAYAWLLTPPESILTSNARKRLRTLQEFTNLGTGYNIALRDLEIRGAGNLLGKEQSGMIAEIGLELYLELIEVEIQKLRNEDPSNLGQVKNDLPIRIDFPGEALIPSQYIEDVQERVEVYRRLEKMSNRKELLEIKAELIDRYGKLPESTQRLLNVVQLRILAKLFSISTIQVEEKSITLVANLGESELNVHLDIVQNWMSQFQDLLQRKTAWVVTKPFGVRMEFPKNQTIGDFIEQAINQLYQCCKTNE